MERGKRQAIRTKALDGISFIDISFVIAQIHFNDFMKRNSWSVDDYEWY